MNLSTTKTLITFITLALFVSIHSNAQQDFQGKAYYQTKTTMDLGNWSGRDLTPEQKKRIEERMKRFLEKQYILSFNKEASMYKEDEKLETVSSGRGWGGFGNSFTEGPKYKNIKVKEIIQDQEFFGKQFLIKDSLKTIAWKLTGDTKQIGNYTCFKATAVKPVDKFDWRSMRRRSRGNRTDNKTETSENQSEKKTDNDPLKDIEVPKTVEVVAWYTPQIPINQGPDDFWGLPGLILEVNADRTTILCTKIVLNPEKKEIIEAPTKGDEVTQAEYNKIITKKMQEMRQLYGGRNRNRRRN